MSTAARVRVYSRAGCHLCEIAEEVVGEVCAALGERYEVVLIDDPGFDPALRRQFTDEVPVTFVDGRQHDFWRVDAGRLRAALTAPDS
ncbi:glutaredoxin family protein [Nocardioides sp. R-C-SC26]|uniref:glutaredoxin family protein n=1 Tax=Nocardioides sp. R-C-SC26 TaxID=2870414 RepID=UPI001E3C6245|nr:glutaredoxin family protein [Nocardioides sp. R-C-SC26]